MEVRQMNVNDWIELFEANSKAESQIPIIEERIERGLPLATWEQNCLKAYQRLNQQKVA